MKSVLTIIILCSVSAIAVNADFGGDGVVDSNDLYIFCGQWLQTPQADPNCDLTEDGSIDLLDYVALLDAWNGEYPGISNVAPTIDVNSVPEPNAIVGEYCYITLTGSDTDGWPEENLSYVITGLPTNGELIDPATWNDSNIVEVPYTLGGYGSNIVFLTDTDTTDSFTYKVWDGNDLSSEATVNISVESNAVDSLCLDGSGYVTIADVNDTIDIVDGRGIIFYMRTNQADCGIMTKREPNGAGWDVRLVNGRIKWCFYDPNGCIGCFGRNNAYRIDFGRWYSVALSYNAGKAYVMRYGAEDSDPVSDNGTDYVSDPNDYTGTISKIWMPQLAGIELANTAPLIVGQARGSANFTGEIDRLRFYSGCDVGGLDIDFLVAASPEWESRMQAASAEVFGTVYEPDVRFMFDEGSGTDLADDKGGLSGTATGNLWLDAYGNNKTNVDTNRTMYYFRRYKRPWDEPDNMPKEGPRKRY